MVNYLYNGVELPALPEWDKETYPYANIIFFEDSMGKYYKLTASAEPVSGVSADGYFSGFSGVAVQKWGVFDYETAWEEATLNNTKGNIIWANHDISTEDGTLYLAATEPVPVGGGEPIDPTSFMQGYIVGRRLAEMRK